MANSWPAFPVKGGPAANRSRLEAEGVHDAGRNHNDGGRLQRFGRVIDACHEVAALHEQYLMQITMPMWLNVPVMQPTTGCDGLDVHQTLVGRLQRLAVQKKGRHQGGSRSTRTSGYRVGCSH